MELLVHDPNPATRAALIGRVQEAVRQAEIRRAEIVEFDPDRIEDFDASLVAGIFIGPGCFDQLGEHVEQMRLDFPTAILGVVLENEIYATSAVTLRKTLGTHVMPLGDLAQIAGFIIDCESQGLVSSPGAGRGVIGFAQTKGGVGTTSLAAAFASCWARHGLMVAAVDLDDVNPQLTEWARVGIAQRTVATEFLRQGEVPPSRINELLHPVESFDGRLVVVGQPERYNESFHFKADVIEGAPSSSEYIYSLLTTLKSEFDVVVVDFSRSWGISTFAALPHCLRVMLVTDDDGMSVRRTLDAVQRMTRESDDPDEFDLARWSLVLNAYTGRLVAPRDIASEIREMDLFPEESTLYTVPFSESGRQWGAPGQTLYDLGEDKLKYSIRKIAYSLVPFRFDSGEAFLGKILKRFQALTGS